MNLIRFSAPHPRKGGTAGAVLLAGIISLGFVLGSPSASASPPSKVERDVSRGLEKASNKVGDFFFKIARKLEQAGFTEEPEPRYFDERPTVRVEVRREEYGDHEQEYIDPDTGLALPPGYPQGYTVRPLPPGRASADIRRAPPRYEERREGDFVPPNFQDNPQPRLTYPRQSVPSPAPVPNPRSRLTLPVNPQTTAPEPQEAMPRVANPSFDGPTIPQERQDEGNMEQGRSEAPASPPAAPKESKTSPSGSLPFATPVPGKQGFVYPPGTEHDMKNMLDVRDFTPGQKVRDPRTGKMFLVPSK